MFEELKKQEELTEIRTRLKKIEDKLNALEKIIKQSKDTSKKGVSQ